MFNIGPVELMVVLTLALLVFGPSKLPELMSSVGHAIREFQRASRELTDVFQETQQDFQSALDLDARSEAQSPPAYESPVDEPVVAETPVSSQPEEFETAAAMIDPIAPFAPPIEAEPVAAIAEPPKPKRARRKKAEEPVAEPPVAAEGTTTAVVIPDAPEPVLAGEPAPVVPGAPEPIVAHAPEPDLADAHEPVLDSEPATILPGGPEPIVADAPEPEMPAAPPTPKRPSRRRATPPVTQGVSAMTPLEEAVAPATNGHEPHANGTAPTAAPARRRGPVAAGSLPTDESA